MNILILYPRLDCAFGAGKGPCQEKEDNSNLPPIRVHWLNFFENLVQHYNKDNKVYVWKRALWEFNVKDVEEIVHLNKIDIVFVPHKAKRDFPISEKVEVRYVMQTVFPHLFTVDSMGWGAERSGYPFNDYVNSVHELAETPTRIIYDRYKERIKNNESKFEQPYPLNNVPYPGYVLFVCQLPHDEVIKYHSKVSVPLALETTLEFCRRNGKRCIVKGHPINPGSMAILKDIQKQYTDCSTWVDDVSIHALIANSESVWLVNSGVGFEAMLHEKPIFCFGNVEYDVAVNKIHTLSDESVDEQYSFATKTSQDLYIPYSNFIANFTVNTVDSSRPETYNRLTP